MTGGFSDWIGGSGFSKVDQEVIFCKLKNLDPVMSTAVVLHFWLGLSWKSIARLYGVEIRKLRRDVSDAIAVLRESCIRDPEFSAYEPAPEQMMVK
jgi:DNA-directed RNA polymerase specialized sigma24 family protein